MREETAGAFVLGVWWTERWVSCTGTSARDCTPWSLWTVPSPSLGRRTPPAAARPQAGATTHGMSQSR